MIWDSPIYISNILVKNRVVFAPISCNWAKSDGSLTDRIIRFYSDVSKGGCGMVVVGGTAVSKEGKGSSLALCLYSKEHLSGFKLIADVIKKNNCLAAIQLMHVGGQGNPNFTGSITVSPSGIKCKATGFTSKELSVKEIKDIGEKFVFSAYLAHKAGFQAVELHLAHGYLLHEFLSEHSNKRMDEYGGSLENRARLILEVIFGIKKKLPNLILGVRVSGNDYVPDGITDTVNKALLPILERAGTDYFSVTAGIYETSDLKHEAMKRGDLFIYSHKVREMVHKPVIGVGKILDLDSAERHLKNRDCDMVAIGRALIADPNMISKVRNGQKFIMCVECEQCQYLRFGKRELECPVRQEDYSATQN